jgi:hypothetical protein
MVEDPGREMKKSRISAVAFLSIEATPMSPSLHPCRSIFPAVHPS